MRPLVLLAVALALNGCAIAALPVAAQVPLWTGMAAAGAAVGMTAVQADSACRQQGGCKAVPLPP
jgi:hypothetical protein